MLIEDLRSISSFDENRAHRGGWENHMAKYTSIHMFYFQDFSSNNNNQLEGQLTKFGGVVIKALVSHKA